VTLRVIVESKLKAHFLPLSLSWFSANASEATALIWHYTNICIIIIFIIIIVLTDSDNSLSV